MKETSLTRWLAVYVLDTTDLYSTYSTRIMNTIKVNSLKYTRQYNNLLVQARVSIVVVPQLTVRSRDRILLFRRWEPLGYHISIQNWPWSRLFEAQIRLSRSP